MRSSQQFILIVFGLLLSFAGIAQNGINYKALIKDGNGDLVANQGITIEFSIYTGSDLINSVYQETHLPATTDSNGIVIVNIGEGTANSGDFETIDWSSDTHYLNVQIDTGGGLTDLGTTEFKAVPYALNALTSSDNHWSMNGGIIYNENESVGVGTNLPIGKVEINYASTTLDPHLTLRQAGVGDAFSRINFASETSPEYWAIAAKSSPILTNSCLNFWNGATDIMSIRGDGQVGINGSILVNNSPSNGVLISSAGTNGFRVNSSALSGVYVQTAGEEGVHVYEAAGNGFQIEIAGENGLHVSSVMSNGVFVNSAGDNGFAVNYAENNGVDVNTADNDGVYVNSVGNDGVHVASADNNGGYFLGIAAGVHASSAIFINPDLVLGGTSNTALGDDGIIVSDPNYSSSDIRITSNDAIVLKLDQDEDEEGNFQIKNGSDETLVDVNESGGVVFNSVNNVFNVPFTINRMAPNPLQLLQLNVVGGLTIAGTLTQNSDRRLKKDIETLSYGLNEIIQLEPKAYLWKTHDQENKSIGLIAQDVQLIMPELVTAQDNEEKTLGISYIEIIPILINGMKEQQEMIEELRNQLDDKNDNVEELTSELNENKESIDRQNQKLETLLLRIELLESKSNQEKVSTQ